MARKPEGSKPRDGYLKEYVKPPKKQGLAFSLLSKFEVIDDPSKTFPVGGFFGRYDFLSSLSEEVWPEGLVVRDYRKGEASDELVVHYKYADREGKINKFLVSTETGWAWRLDSKGGYKLVKDGNHE